MQYHLHTNTRITQNRFLKEFNKKFGIAVDHTNKTFTCEFKTNIVDSSPQQIRYILHIFFFIVYSIRKPFQISWKYSFFLVFFFFKWLLIYYEKGFTVLELVFVRNFWFLPFEGKHNNFLSWCYPIHQSRIGERVLCMHVHSSTKLCLPMCVSVPWELAYFNILEMVQWKNGIAIQDKQHTKTNRHLLKMLNASRHG